MVRRIYFVKTSKRLFGVFLQRWCARRALVILRVKTATFAGATFEQLDIQT